MWPLLFSVDRWKTRLDRLLLLILRRRVWVLALFLGVSVLLGLGFRNLYVDNSLEHLLPEENPMMRILNDEIEEFGSEAPIVITLESEDFFTLPRLAFLDRLTGEVGTFPYVNRVFSLTNAVDVEGNEETVRVVAYERPTKAEEIPEFRRKVLSDPYLVGGVISGDGKIAAVMINAVFLPEDDEYMNELVRRVRRYLGGLEPEMERLGIHGFVTGIPAVYEGVNSKIARDMKVFPIVTAVLIALSLYVLFRSAYGVLLPLGTVLLSFVWTIGLVGVTHRPITGVMSILPPLIMAISIADVVHVLVYFQQERLRTPEPLAALHNTMKHIGLPCFMTSATTAVGFASLTVSEIVPIREFGYFAAFGVAAAFVIAIVLTPIALSFLRRIEVRQQRRKASLQGLLAWIAEVNERHPGKVVGISGILCLLAAFGIPRIAVETNFLEFFKKDDPAVFQVRFIEEHLTAIDILKIVLDGGEPGAFKEPERLAFLEALRAFLEAQPEITRTIAIPDFLKKVNQAFHDGDPQAYRLPETRQAVSQYLLLFEGDDRAEEELARLINFDRSRVRVTALVKMIGSRDQEALLGRIASWMKAHCPPGIHFDFSGAVKISATVMNSVVNAQIESFALALVMITGMMILMLRSWKLGLVSMIPNVLPILLTLGLMGWAAIPLNIATAMTASIAIGLAVDDTIHFLSRYQIERKRLGDPRAAIRTTLLSVGPALITTSVVLFFGFFISIFSSTRPSIHFAILAAVTIVTALLADLFLTPVCLLHLRRGRSLDAQSKGSRSRSQT